MTWETVYTLKLKFALTYIPIATSTGTESGLLQTAYHTDDLRSWSIQRIKQLTKEAIKVRDGRQISDYALGIAKELQEELIKEGMWNDVRRRTI